MRTETGEELLLSEFAPGASISSFAKPITDPMNMPLPSELKGSPVPDDLSDFIPLPSEMASPSKVDIYSDIARGVQDESLFRIKSVFDKAEVVPRPSAT